MTQADDLRRRAEERFDELFATAASVSQDFEATLHELRVHQIELEMQNDELRRAQQELDANRETYVELFDLAPVGDVDSNPANPVIGDRSFGADAGRVATHAAAAIEGLRAGGVLEFGSPEAEFQFRQFAGRRRIAEADLREGEDGSTARPCP